MREARNAGKSVDFAPCLWQDGRRKGDDPPLKAVDSPTGQGSLSSWKPRPGCGARPQRKRAVMSPNGTVTVRVTF